MVIYLSAVSDTTLIVGVKAPIVTVSLGMPDFFNSPILKPSLVFDKSTSCYDGEKELFNIIEMEAINNFGVKCEYYVVDYNTSYDQVFGEDRDRTVLRSFDIKSSLELPTDEDMISTYAIENLDVFEVYINKYHFTFASTFSGDTSGYFPEETPKAGDVLRTNYNEKFYEILSVKDTIEQFHYSNHVWRMIVREYRDLHFNVSASTNYQSISAVTNQQDMFDIASVIDIEKEKYLVSGASQNPDDPFGNW